MKYKSLINISNVVTSLRIILVFFIVWLLLIDDAAAFLVAFSLIIIIIFMDYIDGYFARKLNSATMFGSVFDIVGDRIVENVLWITFSYLKIIPLWIPIVVLTRSFVIDGLRNVSLTKKGKTAFGKKTMMHSKLGRFVVASRFSRGLYAILKAVVFSMLALQLYLTKISYPSIKIYQIITFCLVIITVAFCIIRGIYVITDSLKLFYEKA